jgi:predicted TIM-barrel fold metal-dependent hydrolase
MRQHNQYLAKVTEESDVFRQHLLNDRALTTQQEETFEKIDTLRGWLKQGYSDADVIKLAKNDPRVRVADRRARELLTMAYDIFADLRSARNTEGIKYLYAEQFREAARRAFGEYEILMGKDEYKAAATMLKAYESLLTQAAEIDGAYKETPKKESERRGQKIVIKRKKTTTTTRQGDDGELISETDTTEAEYDSQR